jgi:mono/diheme cytochrome c family protein
MKSAATLFTLGTLLCATMLHAGPTKGEALFDAKCAGCHIKTRPTAKMKKNLTAPPAMGIMNHVKEAFDGDREAVVSFVKSYATNPSEAEAKCLPRSLRRFGVMPSQKDSVTEEELSQIAEYLYDNFPPKGFHHVTGQ